jgi:hypothetical protein
MPGRSAYKLQRLGSGRRAMNSAIPIATKIGTTKNITLLTGSPPEKSVGLNLFTARRFKNLIQLTMRNGSATIAITDKAIKHYI